MRRIPNHSRSPVKFISAALASLFALVACLSIASAFRLPVSPRNMQATLQMEKMQDEPPQRITVQGHGSSLQSFLKGLEDRRKLSVHINREENSEIQALLQTHCQGLTEANFAPFLDSVVSLQEGSKGFIMAREVRLAIFENYQRLLRSKSLEDAVPVLSPMAKLNFKWTELLQNPSLEEKLSSSVLTLRDKALAELLWTMGTAGAQVSSLPSGLKLSLTTSLPSKLYQMTGFSFSSAVWALAKMGFRWQSLSPELRNALAKKTRGASTFLSSPQAAKLIWSFGVLGMSYNELGLPVLECLIIRVGDVKKSQITPNELFSFSTTLFGAGKLGVKYNYCNVAMKRTLNDFLERVLKCQDYTCIDYALNALISLDISRGNLPSNIQELIVPAISRSIGESSARSFSNIVKSLAKLGYKWPDLPKSLRESVLTGLVRLQDDLTGLDVTNLLWSFAQLDLPLDTSPDYFLSTLFSILNKKIESMQGGEVSVAVWGLSGGGLTWNLLPDSLKWGLNSALRRLGDSLGAQETANCAYGLALMCFDALDPADPSFRGVHETMLSIIRSNKRYIASSIQLDNRTNHTVHHMSMNRIELEQLRIFSHYLSTAQYVSDAKRIPKELLDSYQSDKNSGSRLQHRVVERLWEAIQAIPKASEYEVLAEDSSFSGVFPVDAIVRRKGKVVALVEVDGPHHYRHDNKIRRVDLLKESMYRKKHPGALFHRIRYDEEEKVGATVLSREFSYLIQKCAEQSDDVVGNAMRGVVQSLGDFFNWSLRNEADYRS